MKQFVQIPMTFVLIKFKNKNNLLNSLLISDAKFVKYAA